MTPPVRDHDVDPVKSLADFVQSFDPSPTAPPEAAPAAAAAPPAPEVPDEYAGKTPAEIIAEAKANRERAEQSDAAAKTAKDELSRQQTQAEIESTARRIISEQQRQSAPAAPQAAPPPDPRIAKIDELWFTDPPAARQLLNEMNDERAQHLIDAQRETTKREVFTELTERERKTKAEYAWGEHRRRLVAAGVPEADLNNRFKITGLYTAVTLKPTADAPNPYYTDGGPLNPDVLERAWRDLYGAPAAASPAPAPAPTPPPPVVAPPGSSRPAPAAAPPSQVRATPISADTRRDYEHVAAAAGLDPEKMLARRQARIAREGK
jgi:hypothetical protein